MKQCCSGECIGAKYCEEKAKAAWDHKSLFILIITNPMVIFGLGFLCGILFGLL